MLDRVVYELEQMHQGAEKSIIAGVSSWEDYQKKVAYARGLRDAINLIRDMFAKAQRGD